MGDSEAKGYRAEISDEAVKEALDSVEKHAGADGQEASAEVEIQVEPDAGRASGSPEGGPPREELLKTLELVREEAKAARERMLRVAADADNLRKRVIKERDESLKFGMEGLFRDLLPIIDNFERLLSFVPKDSTEPALASLRQGVEMLLRQSTDVLAKYQVVAFSALGEPFDPTRHEAVARTETTDADPGTVLTEVLRGYQIHDRLLRAALVTVACAPAADLPADRCSGTEPNSASGPSGPSGDGTP